jgi:lipopolysaccharide biosynthesis glycosyltransferase
MNINICVACDDCYAPHAAALIASVRKHRGGDDEHIFYVLASHLSGESRRKFAEMERTLNCSIHLVEIDDKPFIGWSAWRRSYATYLRIIMGSILPKNVSKILYLDCDMIVRTSLAPLWETDLTDNYAAVVAEGHAAAKMYSYLNLNVNSLYFNAGMILFNLDKYREDGLEEKILRRGEEMIGKLYCLDQDLLNEAFYGKVIFVPT